MKTDIKEEWKRNLTSGRFPQGIGALRGWSEQEERWEYCCLGVLCEMSGLGEWKYKDERKDHATYLGCRIYLPNAVAEWAGITTDPDKRVQQRIGELNDTGADFHLIARALDTIEDL